MPTQRWLDLIETDRQLKRKSKDPEHKRRESKDLAHARGCSSLKMMLCVVGGREPTHWAVCVVFWQWQTTH